MTNIILKANPTLDMVHIEQYIQNFSVSLFQDPNKYAYSQVFGNIPVQKESDKFVIMNQEYFENGEAEVRAAGTETAGGNFKYDEGRYQVDEYGYHSFVTERAIGNTDKPLDLFKGATQKVELAVRKKLEKLFVSNFLVAGAWGFDMVGAGADPILGFKKFTDTACDPIEVIQRAKSLIHAASYGFDANVLVMTSDIFYKLPSNPALRDLMKYTMVPGVGAFSAPALAALFGVEKVIVLQAVETKGKYFASNKMLLAHIPSTMGLECPASGAIFSHTPSGGNDFGIKMKVIENRDKGGYKVEGTCMTDMQIISPVLGCLLTNVI